MKNKINIIKAKIRTLLNKAVEMSSFEYFNDGVCQTELDEYWCSFAVETA